MDECVVNGFSHYWVHISAELNSLAEFVIPLNSIDDFMPELIEALLK